MANCSRPWLAPREWKPKTASIGPAWERLCLAAGQTDQESVRDEYDTVLVGTGKAPVTLYTCAYSIRYATEAPLAELRGELSALGHRAAGGGERA